MDSNDNEVWETAPFLSQTQKPVEILRHCSAISTTNKRIASRDNPHAWVARSFAPGPFLIVDEASSAPIDLSRDSALQPVQLRQLTEPNNERLKLIEDESHGLTVVRGELAEVEIGPRQKRIRIDGDFVALHDYLASSSFVAHLVSIGLLNHCPRSLILRSTNASIFLMDTFRSHDVTNAPRDDLVTQPKK